MPQKPLHKHTRAERLRPPHPHPPSLSPSPPNAQTAYHYGFNQDASCLFLGSSRGYSIFNTHPFRPSLHEGVGGVGIVEMLYCTSLLALVGAGDQAGFSPRCLKIWNTKRQASLFDVAFVSKIVAVRLNRRRLVVRPFFPSLHPSFSTNHHSYYSSLPHSLPRWHLREQCTCLG